MPLLRLPPPHGWEARGLASRFYSWWAWGGGGGEAARQRRRREDKKATGGSWRLRAARHGRVEARRKATFGGRFSGGPALTAAAPKECSEAGPPQCEPPPQAQQPYRALPRDRFLQVLTSAISTSVSDFNVDPSHHITASASQPSNAPPPSSPLTRLLIARRPSQNGERQRLAGRGQGPVQLPERHHRQPRHRQAQLGRRLQG